MNLLRQWSQPSSVSNIFPVLPSASLQQAVSMLNDKTAPDLEMLEDEKDGDEKTLTDDSRSPSEEGSNGGNRIGDEFSSTIDSGDKPFECEHTNCHKRFANKFLLKKHQFIHTGLRPHSCPYCGKKFNRKDNLLRHKKTHVANAVVNAKRRHTMVFGVPETMLGLGESSAIVATMPEGEGDDDDL